MNPYVPADQCRQKNLQQFASSALKQRCLEDYEIWLHLCCLWAIEIPLNYS